MPSLADFIKQKIMIFRFLIFTMRICKDTWKHHDELLAWAEHQTNQKLKKSSQSRNNIYKDAQLLREKLTKKFKGLHKKSGLRILIHVPPSYLSPGGFSLFNNLLQGLQFVGIKADGLYWDDNFSEKLRHFKPNVLLTSDSPNYLAKIDWEELRAYRQKHSLEIGLTASIEPRATIKDRISAAQQRGVTFFYSFCSSQHIQSFPAFSPFFQAGYSVLSVEFGANPLLYFPINNHRRDLPYIFLASSNADKWSRYFEYLPSVVNNVPGFIDGPGWFHLQKWAPPELHRFLYSRAKGGLNLHIPDSVLRPSELNERTYILAASGVPQLVDNAVLLRSHFPKEAFFVAKNPSEYRDLFFYMIEHPQEAQRRAQIALKYVLQHHTSFHRASSFVQQLTTMKKRNAHT